jgi:hypothetical protein
VYEVFIESNKILAYYSNKLVINLISSINFILVYIIGYLYVQLPHIIFKKMKKTILQSFYVIQEYTSTKLLTTSYIALTPKIL